MDPAPLLNPEWTDIGDLLTNLWIEVGLIVFIATNMLVGHIFIPSLVNTEHIPARVMKLRPIFYALAALTVSLVVIVMYMTIAEAVIGTDGEGFIDRFYKKFWI